VAQTRTLPRTRRPLDTASRLGVFWDRYRDVFPHYEAQLLERIAPLGAGDFAGRDVLDAGCGMGRHALFAAHYGARSVLAVDSASLSVHAAHELLADVPRVRVERRSIYELPIKRAFDLVLAVDVLHHLQHPRLALEKLSESLRCGGRLVAWLQGYEANEGFARVFRRIHPALRHLPPRALHGLAYLLSTPLFLGLPLRRSHVLASATELRFRPLHAQVVGALVPEISRYYRREEVEALFGELELQKCEVRESAGGWTVICEK
jgi:SAM-dependent methyltransferase